MAPPIAHATPSVIDAFDFHAMSDVCCHYFEMSSAELSLSMPDMFH